MKCNHSRPGFELELLCPFPMTITITPRSIFIIINKNEFDAKVNSAVFCLMWGESLKCLSNLLWLAWTEYLVNCIISFICFTWTNILESLWEHERLKKKKNEDKNRLAKHNSESNPNSNYEDSKILVYIHIKKLLLTFVWFQTTILSDSCFFFISFLI